MNQFTSQDIFRGILPCFLPYTVILRAKKLLNEFIKVHEDHRFMWGVKLQKHKLFIFDVLFIGDFAACTKKVVIA